MLRKDSRFGPFFSCPRWPQCDYRVGAHRRGGEHHGQPLGRPADQHTRRARRDAHLVFDRIWRRPRGTRAENQARRGKAYRWLAQTLAIPEAECHIGSFDLAMCVRVIQACHDRLEREDR